MKLKYYFLIYSAILALFLGCAKQPTPAEETILAKIGSKTISVNEFIRRSEYTIRPAWCSEDNYVHRKIVLNSLIAEKLLALEAGTENELAQNSEFQLYLTGRKEQAMRQWLYQQQAVEHVRLDSAEINKEYKLAGRKYKVSYFTVPTEEMAQVVQRALKDDTNNFNAIYSGLAHKETPPQKEIDWQSAASEIYYDQLFNPDIKKGEILKPIKAEQGGFLILRVDGWSDFPAVSEQQKIQRVNDVRERLTEKKALSLYGEYVAELMKGQSVQFNRPVFEKLVNSLGPDYYKSEKEKKDTFNKKFWNKDRTEMILDDPANQLKQILDKPLFTHEGRTWKVHEFIVELMRHPLVFRKRNMPKNEFAEQFKLAIVDMIRDQHITREAYKKGYDKAPVVRRNYNMWRDNLFALYQKKKILDAHTINGLNSLEQVEQILNPYIRQLQKKYETQIEINTDVFEDIKLTNVDMFVIQKNVPFPVIVPSFPQLTTRNQMDYGRKMK